MSITGISVQKSEAAGQLIELLFPLARSMPCPPVQGPALENRVSSAGGLPSILGGLGQP